MPILRNIRVLYPCADRGTQSDLGSIQDAAIVWRHERILWLGEERAIPPEYLREECFDAQGMMVIPGLIDCHTHLAFAGRRFDEFEKRTLGKSYVEIANEGGGIASTVHATRAASEDELLAQCQKTLLQMQKLGVTAIECKSGYGLSLDEELKLLRVYKKLQALTTARIVPTLLAAHTIPEEFKARRADYVSLICNSIIPEAKRQELADFCDVFVEQSAFTREEGKEILEAGKRFGLKPRIHADQLSDGGGAALAAEVGSASADHLEFVSDQGIRAMSQARVTATLLPFSALYLNQPPLNARRFIEANVPVTVASNYNPGSAPSFHLPLAMTLACTMNRLTASEALKGATILAAKVLGISNSQGSLERGKLANFAVIESEDVNQWLYEFKANACRATYILGQPVY